MVRVAERGAPNADHPHHMSLLDAVCDDRLVQIPCRDRVSGVRHAYVNYLIFTLKACQINLKPVEVCTGVFTDGEGRYRLVHAARFDQHVPYCCLPCCMLSPRPLSCGEAEGRPNAQADAQEGDCQPIECHGSPGCLIPVCLVVVRLYSYILNFLLLQINTARAWAVFMVAGN